jgi:hypothetical protein
LLGDQIFVNPVFEQAKALSAGGKGNETKTWVYHLTTGVESLLKFSPIKLGIMCVLVSFLSPSPPFSPSCFPSFIADRPPYLSPLSSHRSFGHRHAMDIPLVFNTSSLWANDKTSSDAKTAAAIGERWFRFAIEGNPGASSSWLFLLCTPNTPGKNAGRR